MTAIYIYNSPPHTLATSTTVTVLYGKPLQLADITPDAIIHGHSNGSHLGLGKRSFIVPSVYLRCNVTNV